MAHTLKQNVTHQEKRTKRSCNMRFTVKHRMEGRVRIHLLGRKPDFAEADQIEKELLEEAFIKKVKVYERTGDVAIWYTGKEKALFSFIYHFTPKKPEKTDMVSPREIDAIYREKIINKFLKRYSRKFFLPFPIRNAIRGVKVLKFALRGLKCLVREGLKVEVLDGLAVSVSFLRKDYSTAGNVMFMLSLGDILETWSHKRAVANLAGSMDLTGGEVWLQTDAGEVLVKPDEVKKGDCVSVYSGNVIPFDGIVTEGEAMVNQVSITGEPMPAEKRSGVCVYAGTTVEEGKIVFEVTRPRGGTRYEQILKMIEDSERLKSGAESRAENLADSLVPYSFLGMGLVYLLTRNTQKALAILMVDYSCALKLTMPLAVLSAMKEGREKDIVIKGGKFLETVSEADTIVFDKTGTLTKAEPHVESVVSFNGEPIDELLRKAACLEEHFPHSIATAVVEEAKKRGLIHAEMHSEVQYIVAHGIVTKIDDSRVIIGSHHFVFEDEQIEVPEGREELFESLPAMYTHLYMAIDGKLAAVILISDPIKEEVPGVMEALAERGLNRIIMMTGDGKKMAESIAKEAGIKTFYAEVLPKDKADYVKKEKAAGRTVLMMGDGINDAPALAEADTGISVSTGAEIARTVSDITLKTENLESLVVLRDLSDGLMKRIDHNYRAIGGINTGLILLGVFGILSPQTAALLHNLSTLSLSIKSMGRLLPEEV